MYIQVLLIVANVRPNNPALITASQNCRIAITPRDHPIHIAVGFPPNCQSYWGKQGLRASCYRQELTTTQGSSFWGLRFRKLSL